MQKIYFKVPAHPSQKTLRSESPFSVLSIFHCVTFEKQSAAMRWHPRPWIINCNVKLKICQSSYILNSFKQSFLLLCGYSFIRDQNRLRRSCWRPHRKENIQHIVFKTSKYDTWKKKKSEMAFDGIITSAFVEVLLHSHAFKMQSLICKQNN